MYGESSLVNSRIKLFYDASWLMKQIFLVLEVSSYRNRIAGELKRASPLVMYAKRISPKKESGTACQKYLFSSATARKIRKTNFELNKRERTTKQKWNKCKTHKLLCGCYLWEIFIFFIVSSVGFSLLVPYRLLENFTYCCFLIAFYWNLLWRLVCKKKLIWFSFLLFSDCFGLVSS